jgi:acetyl esterase/lipase
MLVEFRDRTEGGALARRVRRVLLAAAIVVAASLGCGREVPVGEPGSIEPDGTVVVAPFRLPPSIYLSDEAKAALPREPTDRMFGLRVAVATGTAGLLRDRLPELMADQLDHLVELYPVTMRQTTIAGVPAVLATPADEIPGPNRNKLLLNLPGGGFVMGEAGSTGMTESIPLAVLAKTEIVSITYRQAPETSFPAASEDVAAVYRELLETRRPEDIAIFGCSAGGMLTAQAMAWFAQEGLPFPGAIGIFCAAADARRGGDSRAWDRALQALPLRGKPAASYFEAGDADDSLASPILDSKLLERFPPTLIVTAVRAWDLSPAVSTHRALVRAGVETELHVWDGLGHAFFYDIGLPESREAFEVMARFFRKHLDLAE